MAANGRRNAVTVDHETHATACDGLKIKMMEIALKSVKRAMSRHISLEDRYIMLYFHMSQRL